MKFLFDRIKEGDKKYLRKIVEITFFAIIIGNLAGVAVFMIESHPYEYLYFNILAGKNMREAKRKFEFDYWGLAYREALEYILKHDKGRAIKIYDAFPPLARANSYILPVEDRKRLVFVNTVRKAKYILDNYYGHKNDIPCRKKFFAVKVKGATAISVILAPCPEFESWLRKQARYGHTE